MKSSRVVDRLWGHKARLSYLLFASILLLFTFLGGREIWTQEHRWADIVSGMLYRQDFLHPYLGEIAYYDKPLLSYWMIVFLVKLTNTFTTTVLRLPSALAGLLAIWSIYRLGTALKDKQLGLLAGWLLLTTFYFVFWARVSSSDMLNLAGSLFAIAWYKDHAQQTSLFNYIMFFIILACTSLCKGLIGAIVPLIAVITDIFLRYSWKQHINLKLFLAVVPAIMIYFFPFWASSYFGNEFHENGLYLVYRENFLRYFQPFDHQGPIYTYLIYLPLYLLPSAIFFIPALFSLKLRWQEMSIDSKWIAWVLLLLFGFFTLSGSRRSYYVLSIVPFAILFTADWILAKNSMFARKETWSARLIVFSFILLFTMVDVLPAWYYSQFGIARFADILKNEVGKVKPWGTWNIVLLDAESKLKFYLKLPPNIKNYQIKGTERNLQTAETVLTQWPVLLNNPTNTIFISRKRYTPILQKYFIGYRKIALLTPSPWLFGKKQGGDAPIAFIPLQ